MIICARINMQKLFFLKKNEYISFIKDIESPMYNQRASHNISKLKEYIPDKRVYSESKYSIYSNHVWRLLDIYFYASILDI
jgi:hypothetical protein